MNRPNKARSGWLHVEGIIEEINETTLRITDLPIRRWTRDYKEFLESIMTENDKIKDLFIKVTMMTQQYTLKL